MIKYVITGGPGIGKTTTLAGLELLGYEIVPEAARMVKEEEEQKQNPVLPETDLYGFQELVVARQLKLEQRIKRYPAFLDRGLFDNIGYCRLGEINIPPTLENNISSTRYARVFLLEPLSNYANDPQRPESRELALQLHQKIEQVYRDLRYDVISIPELSPEERVKLILSKI